MAVVIRRARADEADTLVHFNCAMAAETEGKALDPHCVLAGVRAVFEDPRRGSYWVAANPSTVLGSLLITYEWSDWRNADFWWIQSVYVRPEARGAGVFAALYRELARQATAQGACGLRLYVEQNNARAKAVYAALGMVDAQYLVMEQVFP